MSVTTQTQANEKRTQPSTWEFDPAHSSVELSVRHLMISTVTGRFKSLRGSVTRDEAAIENSRVEAEIDAASIDTGVADRDNHLRSADFFDVANHPKLVFRSTKIEDLGGDSGRMHGELTIRGVTRPVILAVSYLGEIRDPWGNRRRGFSAETTLYRKDFGMTWNQVLDTGGVLVGDKIKVSLNIEAVEKHTP
ncbi:MAG TPA: YceI family protein [Thermoplasmata archaeon]|nr:YceI family protein [Thermoplasmata archaeon]